MLMVTEKLLTIDDETDWRAALPADVSVFGSVEYARISQEHSGQAAQLLVIQSGGSLIAYPFFMRSIASLPFASKTTDAFWDISTPEYTGPIRLGWEPFFTPRFADVFTRHCQAQRVVAEFAHLHPWNAQAEFLESSCIEFNREIVYVDLTLPEERLWRDSFTYACRKNINRARRENVRVFAAETAGDIREFHRIYTQTMERSRALDKYYFPLNYFMALFEQMPDHARFVLAEYDDQIVAATLYLHDAMNVYSYLGGADHAFQHVRPTNAVVYDTIVWAQSHGKHRLVLGGGYKPDDGIARFKASFSPLRARFNVYKRIHLPDKYSALCTGWSAYYGCKVIPSGYFPPYRIVPPASVRNLDQDPHVLTGHHSSRS